MTAPANETPARAPELTPAHFGWTEGVKLPDLWDPLTEPNATVSFAILVRARQHTRDPRLRAEARLAERALRRKFVEQEGAVQAASYCERVVGGVALTERTEQDRRREIISRKLHTVLNSGVPELVALEAKCGALADNAVTAFCGRTSQLRQLRTSTDMVFSVMTRVLRAANELAATPPPDRARRNELVRIADTEYAHARKHIGAAIQRQARFTYFQGTLLGALVTILACAALGLASHHWWSAVMSPPAFVASIVFGALGAVTSVFQRMSTGQLVLDFTTSRLQMIALGAARPFVGAVFGAIAYFGLIGGVLGPGAATASPAAVVGFSALTGFAAGFSERLATDMIERAGKVLGGQTPTTPEEEEATGTRITSRRQPAG